MSKINLNKIPKNIHLKLSKISSRQVVAGCIKSFSAEDIKNGLLSHLGISLQEKGLVIPKSIVPPAKSGKYSHRNVHGQEIVRKDLPKETHYHTVQAPNFGDRWKGTHSVDLPNKKYPRDFKAPAFSQIKIESPNIAAGQNAYLIKFEVNTILDRDDPDFEKKLLVSLNLLQENIGYCGVEAAGISLTEYAKTLQISWEILPPGTREEAIDRISRGHVISDQERRDIGDRYDFLMSLSPSKLIYGTSGLIRYFGALLREDLVVFENIEYGNAIYIMFDDWKALSQRTRIELISGRFGKNFERVVHLTGWKKKVHEIVKQRLSQKRSFGVGAQSPERN